MKKKTEETVPEGWLKDLPLQTENPAFLPDEMVDCKQCRRLNPPTRAICLYCGAQMKIAETRSRFLKTNPRRLETWEKGFNLIFTGDSEALDSTAFDEAALLLKTEKDLLPQIAEAKKPLPLARLGTEKEAEIIQNRLLGLGIETKIVRDEDLKIEKATRRLRAMDFWEDKLVLILFNADEIREIHWRDVNLIVTGAIFERRVETTETRRKKGESKLLEASETASDELLIDIYSREDEIGWRIEQNGFDFSCLGAEKSLLAAENIRRLVETLSAKAPNVKLVEDYRQIRGSLANVWQVEEKTDSQGLKRESFGSFNIGSITTVSNAAQFTKYSRLRRHLL